MKKIVLGTRGSRLALVQAELVSKLISSQFPDLEIEIKTIKTTGDQSAKPLGDGIFVKEIQNALLHSDIDIAVHSLKDLPTIEVDGLTVAAIPQREAPNEVLFGGTFDSLPEGARVGTGSPRRSAQILFKRQDLKPVPIRGNVPTRVAMVTKGEVDAILIAQAGLNRLDIKIEGEILEATDLLPAPGQGAIGIEARSDDSITIDLLAQLDHSQTRVSVTAERRVLRHLGGGCMLPVGAYGQIAGQEFRIHAGVISSSGRNQIKLVKEGSVDEADKLALSLANELINKGALNIL